MEQRGPWKIKAVKTPYQNQWMKVHEHQVIRPDGKDGIYGVVEAIGGACALPIDAEGNVYLVKEYRFPLQRESIELAGGGFNPGEEPLLTAQRELREELGIEAKEWINMGKFDPFTSIIKSEAHMFIAKQLTFLKQELDPCEQIEIVKVPFTEAVRMVMEGKITHGASCFLILKAKELFNNSNLNIKGFTF